jgi:hypothetical protein
MLKSSGCASISMTYFWHNRFTRLVFHITKGHFGTFILVDPELWEIDIGNFVKRYCG